MRGLLRHFYYLSARIKSAIMENRPGTGKYPRRCRRRRTNKMRLLASSHQAFGRMPDPEFDTMRDNFCLTGIA